MQDIRKRPPASVARSGPYNRSLLGGLNGFQHSASIRVAKAQLALTSRAATLHALLEPVGLSCFAFALSLIEGVGQ
jgi:hypothetical protein